MNQRCEAMSRYDWRGPIEPRQCLRRPIAGSRFCGVHARRAELPTVRVVGGGFCVWCTAPATAFQCTRDATPIALCNECARALVQAIGDKLKTRVAMPASATEPMRDLRNALATATFHLEAIEAVAGLARPLHFVDGPPSHERPVAQSTPRRARAKPNP